MVHVFVVGSKGIPAQYGGFETFVENLTALKISDKIKYHVSCMNNDECHFEYNDADCFNVKLPLKGAPGRILHVSRVLSQVEKWCKENKKSDDKVIVYILGCRIGPLLIPHANKLRSLDVKIYCNPDGLEWKRSKWSALEKKFLLLCERCLVINSDMAICDSKNIEKYIKQKYKLKDTAYIAYGADVIQSSCADDKLNEWYNQYGISKNNYYLVVGRFVPENNYETIIKEFMRSETPKDLVIVTNVEKNKFYQSLLEKTGFDKDKRVKFVGTVYDAELIKKIREEAYGYLHGHEVGGTNPSLLEALASTKLNLLLDVGFNREVAQTAALYWTKDLGNLAELLTEADEMGEEDIAQLSNESTNRIIESFSWKYICEQYEKLWLEPSDYMSER